MRPLSLSLTDELAELVDRERRRRGVSAATVIRAAVEEYLSEGTESQRYSIVGAYDSGGDGKYSAADLEEFLERHWTSDIAGSSGMRPPGEK